MSRIDELEKVWDAAMLKTARECSRVARDEQDAIEARLLPLPCVCGHQYGDHENRRGRCDAFDNTDDGRSDCICSGFVDVDELNAPLPAVMAEDEDLARQLARRARRAAGLAQAAAHAAGTEAALDRLADLVVVADAARAATVDYATVAIRLAPCTPHEADAAAAMRIASTACELARDALQVRAATCPNQLGAILAAARDRRVA